MELTIPTISEDPLTVPIEVGEQLYVVGANGTGKSALFQHWVGIIGSHPIKRVAAHRQNWFESGDIGFTARSRRQFESNVMVGTGKLTLGGWNTALPSDSRQFYLIWLLKKTNEPVISLN